MNPAVPVGGIGGVRITPRGDERRRHGGAGGAFQQALQQEQQQPQQEQPAPPTAAPATPQAPATRGRELPAARWLQPRPPAGRNNDGGTVRHVDVVA